MSLRIPKIKNDVQGRNSVAWKRLCEYVNKVASEKIEEFDPLKELGPKLYAKIHTLPGSISKLKNVKKVLLYGSKLKRIPPEIGEMEALEYFDTYNSLDLHWFPYEITRCKNLKASRVTYRALYGNTKKPIAFPRLQHNPVRYFGNSLKCSVCGKEVTYDQINQLWTSLKVETFVLPLLANVCSENCESRLPQSPEGHPFYARYAHKGCPTPKELRAAGVPNTIQKLWSYCVIAGYILIIPLSLIGIVGIPLLILNNLPTSVQRILGAMIDVFFFLNGIVVLVAVFVSLFRKKS